MLKLAIFVAFACVLFSIVPRFIGYCVCHLVGAFLRPRSKPK